MKNLATLVFLLLSIYCYGQRTDTYLLEQSDTIRQETTPGANTRHRVSRMYDGLTLSKVNKRTPEFLDSADITKRIKFYFNGSHPTATTYNVTWPNKSGTVAFLDDIVGGISKAGNGIILAAADSVVADTVKMAQKSDLSSWLTGTLTGNVSVSGADVNMSFTNTESGTGTNSIILRSSNSGGNDTELKIQSYDFYIRDVTSGYNPIYLSNPGVVNIRGFNVNNNVTIDENADNLVGISQTSGKRLQFTDSYTILNLGSDATGDIPYRNSSGYLTRLPIGTNGQVLTVGGSGLPSWATPSSGIGGSVGSTDNALLRADVGSGVVQSSPVTIDDSGNSTWGTGQTGSSRSQTADGSASDVGWYYATKGNGDFFWDGSSTATATFSLSRVDIANSYSTTNSVVEQLRFIAATTGTAGAGLGSRIRTTIENSAGDAEEGSSIITQWVNATDGSEHSSIEFHTNPSGSMDTFTNLILRNDSSKIRTGNFVLENADGALIGLDGKLKGADLAGTSLSINSDIYVGMNIKSLNAAETDITIGKDVSVESVMTFTQWGDGILNLLEGTDVDITGKTSTTGKGDMIWLHLIEKSGGISYYIGR